jgi:hypothetical protein
MKTSELTGAALDWAVAQCEGDEYAPEFAEDHDGNEYPASAYSTDWSQGGPIIERETIELYKNMNRWAAIIWVDDEDAWELYGSTPLVAAMRCFVASKLGAEVDIPAELKD